MHNNKYSNTITIKYEDMPLLLLIKITILAIIQFSLSIQPSVLDSIEVVQWVAFLCGSVGFMREVAGQRREIRRPDVEREVSVDPSLVRVGEQRLLVEVLHCPPGRLGQRGHGGLRALFRGRSGSGRYGCGVCGFRLRGIWAAGWRRSGCWSFGLGSRRGAGIVCAKQSEQTVHCWVLESDASNERNDEYVKKRKTHYR